MKWVKRRGTIPPNIPPDERQHFEEIDLITKDCEDDVKDPLKAELSSKGYDLWDRHDFSSKHFKKNAQRKYEAFVGGFLVYYELEHEKRKIFFEWCDKDQKNYVRIFINRPASVIANPPRPPAPPPPESSE